MKILETIEKYLLYIVVAIFPLFILLNSTSPIVLPKAELLVVSASIIIALWLVRTVWKGSLSFAVGKFDLGVLLLAISYSLSTILKTPNKMEAFLIPGFATFVLISAVFYFLVNQTDKKGKGGVLVSFFVSGVLLSLSLIFTELGLFSKIPQLPALIKDPFFNPLGGAIPALTYLMPVLLIGLSLLLKDKDLIKKTFWGVSSAVVVVAAVILIGSALPGKPQAPNFPSFQATWEVAVNSIAKSPLLGMGPGNYLSAFNQFRPVTYNQTSLWSVRFTTASDYFLTAITETGLLGLFALIVLLFSLYKLIKSEFRLELLAPVSILILIAAFPASPVLMFPLLLLLAVVSKSESRVITINTFAVGGGAKLAPRVPLFIIALVVLGGVIAFDFFGVKAVVAEATFAKSLTAIGQNDAKSTYNLMQSAINQNPRVDRYHAALAQVDMAIAQSLAAKKDISDSDKQTITRLVQQAINEGKSTVVLNPARAGNWEVLAQIYRSVMPFASGADQFAIQTYTQAIALDPTNPNLRISLGGVYYALGRFDDAIDAFKLAVLAKPDLGNAHYNLAIAYREKKNFDSAITEINTVLNLVKKDSPDYNLAKTTLDELEKNKPAGSSDNLTAPQPKGTSTIKPPITLPQEAIPPASQ